MSDKIRDMHSRVVKNLHGGDQMAAALSYIPVLGWIYGRIVNKDDEFCQFHGSQSLRLNILYLCFFFIIWTIQNFPLTAWLFGDRGPLFSISQTLIIVSTMAFLAISCVAAYKAFTEERWEIPYLEETVDYLKDLLNPGKI